MRAAVYKEFAKPLIIQNLPDPTPSDRGVVIRVKATGLCRSDWHGWMGHDPDISLPHVPGHELAGVIEATGKGVVRWNIGDRVTLPFVCGCGNCPQCASGNHQVCDWQFQPGFTHWGLLLNMLQLIMRMSIWCSCRMRLTMLQQRVWVAVSQHPFGQ